MLPSKIIGKLFLGSSNSVNMFLIFDFKVDNIILRVRVALSSPSAGCLVW